VSASASRRHARDAAKAASKPGVSTPMRGIAAHLALAHALLELAHQVGRLADQVPVYGPPDERDR
jgi:hypothetical protein